MKLPNHLTIARLYLTFIFVILFSIDSVYTFYYGLVVFVLAAITDIYDGRFARSYKIISKFGKVMDPVADKILACSGYIIIVKSDIVDVPAFPVIVILMREFFVTGLKTIKAAEGTIISARLSGKIKTTFQFIAIITILVIIVLKKWFITFVPNFKMNDFYLINEPIWLNLIFDFFNYAPIILIYIAMIATLYSGYDYFKHFKELLNNE